MLSQKSVLSLVIAALLSACATKTPAPVIDRRAPSATTPSSTVSTAPAAKNPAASPTPERAPQAPTPATGPITVTSAPAGKTHTVQRGETMYGIAFQNNLDYRELALWNNIENPALIKVGDVLRLTPPGAVVPAPSSTPAAPSTTAAPTTPVTPTAAVIVPAAPVISGNTTVLKAEPVAGKVPYTDAAMARINAPTTPPIAVPSISLPANAGTAAPAATAPSAPISVSPSAATTPAASSATTSTAAAARETVDFAWPVKGSVITTFTELNKGIDIAGARGTAVLAAAPGTVIHTGAGIRGYGRLVIVKHAGNLVSAYAHNDKIVVTEGQEVKRGQKIAEMGNSDADQVKLHFEIRRQGKPVDPMTLLPRQ